MEEIYNRLGIDHKVYITAVNQDGVTLSEHPFPNQEP
jgi:hypothetical protein